MASPTLARFLARASVVALGALVAIVGILGSPVLVVMVLVGAVATAAAIATKFLRVDLLRSLK